MFSYDTPFSISCHFYTNENIDMWSFLPYSYIMNQEVIIRPLQNKNFLITLFSLIQWSICFFVVFFNWKSKFWVVGGWFKWYLYFLLMISLDIAKRKLYFVYIFYFRTDIGISVLFSLSNTKTDAERFLDACSDGKQVINLEQS